MHFLLLLLAIYLVSLCLPVFNKSRLRSDTRVKFKVENSDKGLVAIDVKLEKVAQESEPLTDNDIKAMFGVLLVFQLIIAYFVFIA